MDTVASTGDRPAVMPIGRKPKEGVEGVTGLAYGTAPRYLFMDKGPEFRSRALQLVLDVDASTITVMHLVRAHQMAGQKWCTAIAHQDDCIDKWQSYITGLNRHHTNRQPPRID